MIMKNFKLTITSSEGLNSQTLKEIKIHKNYTIPNSSHNLSNDLYQKNFLSLFRVYLMLSANSKLKLGNHLKNLLEFKRDLK
jgi:hypothetical protein